MDGRSMYTCWLAGGFCPQWQAYKKVKGQPKKKNYFGQKRSHMADHIWQAHKVTDWPLELKWLCLSHFISSQIKSNKPHFSKLRFVLNTQDFFFFFINWLMIMANPFKMWDTVHFLMSHSETKKKETSFLISHDGLIS